MDERKTQVGDYLVIASNQTGIPLTSITRAAKVNLIESALAAPYAGFGEFLLFPDFEQRAAVLCSRLIRNHPLPDGNKRSAYITMIYYVEVNGRRFNDDERDHNEIAATIEDLAAGLLSETAFTEWVRARLD